MTCGICGADLLAGGVIRHFIDAHGLPPETPVARIPDFADRAKTTGAFERAADAWRTLPSMRALPGPDAEP